MDTCKRVAREFASYQKAIDSLNSRIEEKKREMQKLCDVLEWYADEGNYTHDENGNLISGAWVNNRLGLKARKIIKEIFGHTVKRVSDE